MKNPCQKRSPG